MAPLTRFAIFASASLFGLIAFGSLKASSAPWRCDSAAFNAGALAKIDAIARTTIANGELGITVGINDPLLGCLLASYGTSDLAGTPLSPSQHYRIASVTKTFTAYAVLHLIELGKLSMNDRIAKYVPTFPRGDTITIRDLLAMRSGVYDFMSDDEFAQRWEGDPPLPDWTPNATLALIERHASQFATADKRTSYSNSDYILLGFVIAKVTDERPETYVRSLLETFDLPETSFPIADALPEPYVRGYFREPGSGSLRDVTLSNPMVSWTSGAMVSTVPDMLRYAAELGTGVGLSPATFKLRETWGTLQGRGVPARYGLGLTRLGQWIGQNGAILGYTNDVFYLPSARASVVVMVNQGGSIDSAFGVWSQIVDLLYPGTLDV